jgi:ABC-type lipoprotein export system ATPase subunit
VAREYLRRCHQVGLEVIGITDHNLATRAQDSFIHFLRQENRFVADELKREMMTILPGFEITADVGTGVHVLAVFDRDTELEVLDGRLASLGLPFDNRFAGDGTPKPTAKHLREILKEVQDRQEHAGIVIAAHPFSGPGLLNDDVCENWLQQEEFTNPELLCMELPKERSKMSAGFQKLLSAGDDCEQLWLRNRSIACILSSDAYRLKSDPNDPGNHLGYRHTWIKMSKPTIEALRQAFLDHESRVEFGPDSPDARRRHGRLMSFSVHGASYLFDQEIHFAPGLTCIIGGRGSGKSTVVEYLRFALRRDQDNSASASAQIQRLASTLPSTSSLRVHWRSGEAVDDFFGVRGYKLNQIVAQVLNRSEPVASPETVFRNLGVQVFSQRQLSEMAEGPALLRFVDQLLSKDLANPQAATRGAEIKVKALLEKNALLGIARQSLAVVKEEVNELTRQWNARSEVATEATQHKTAQEGGRHLERMGMAIEETVGELRGVATSVEQKVPRLGGPAQHWNSADTYRQFESAVLSKFAALRVDLSALADRFESEVAGLLNAESIQALRLAINQAETAFLTACEQRGLTPADVERIKEVDQQLRAKNTERDAKQREVDRLRQEAAGLTEALNAMHTAWREETNMRSSALTRLTGIINKHGQFLTCSVVHQGSQEDFEARIWKTMELDRRTILGRNWGNLGAGLFQAFRATEQRTSYWDFVVAWIGGATVPALTEWNEFRDDLKMHFENEQIKPRWEEFRTLRIADWLDFTLHRRDGTRAGSISDGQLSEGQRNTIVLSLLLADGDAPIVVDQPEDELDSDFIFNELVPVVRGCKGMRQIIFVTHNANLPVNADADLVYALEFREGKGQLRAQGGLDLPRVSKAVLDIMEGSRDAFERRREKYHF